MKQIDDYLPAILVKIGGMVIFTLALFKLPKALAALVQFISSLWLRAELGEVDGGADALVANAIHTSAASSIGNLLAFVILLLIARWLFSYPKILQNWFQKTDDAFRSNEGTFPINEAEQDTAVKILRNR